MTTGHEKANITVILAASANGKKKKPFVIFKGKGLAKEIKELKQRRDIVIGTSENGWANEQVISDWINANFSDISFTKRLLIWDSFKGHIAESTKQLLKRKRIDQAVIPGGCTGILQAPDVVWNKPFKVSTRKYYSKISLLSRKMAPVTPGTILLERVFPMLISLLFPGSSQSIVQ